ncbi:MAG TPA: toxin-antitoxin system YwqK family antitoxin [Bacteroidales bacterium]|nr:toxin-antitoxin system YwqK family antitoxin [Bacteroidales bacterium]
MHTVKHILKQTSGGAKSILLLAVVWMLTSVTASTQELVKGSDGFYLNGQLFTGEYVTRHANGQLESVRSFVHGLEDGVSRYYDLSGNLIELRAWSNGKKHGTWITFNTQGHKTGEANYQNDLKHGKWFIWDEQGILRYEMLYTNGKKTGTWFMWDEQGQLVEKKEYL